MSKHCRCDEPWIQFKSTKHPLLWRDLKNLQCYVTTLQSGTAAKISLPHTWQWHCQYWHWHPPRESGEVHCGRGRTRDQHTLFTNTALKLFCSVTEHTGIGHEISNEKGEVRVKMYLQFYFFITRLSKESNVFREVLMYEYDFNSMLALRYNTRFVYLNSYLIFKRHII